MKNKISCKTPLFSLALALCARCAIGASAPSAPDGREWEDCFRLSLGKEAPRAFFFPFAENEDAKDIFPGDGAARAVSLDSTTEWRFKWAPDPASRPAGFQNPAYDVSGWDVVRVPCSWQADGISPRGRYGTPLYTNATYPFKRDKPRVTGEPPHDWTAYKARNPVGSYRRDFTLPEGWSTDAFDVFAKFDAVDSFFYLWINGQYCGFSKDSRSPAEFDVTRFLRPGRNTVALEVYRYSDGSYLEDQDMFRLSGIARSVWLLARPKTRIRDFFANPSPARPGDLRGDWIMDVTGELAGAAPAGATVKATLYRNAGFELYRRAGVQPPPATPVASAAATAGADGRFSAPLRVASPALWSAETPNCYTLVLELAGRDGRPGEKAAAVVGFRTSQIVNGRFEVNGKKIKMRGANRHETHPLYGHFVPRSVQEHDVAMLKGANLNQVRNSHYPQDDYWYYLCNIYGLYLCDEANVESHGYGYGRESLSHDRDWEKPTVDRVLAMFARNKNNPSIVIWSLGNEAGPGENFAASAAALKARDRSRPIQYERDNSVADFDSNMYPSVGWVWHKAGDRNAKKPFYIIEYAHSMLNAMGNLKDYQNAIESSDVIAGASIWDWVDQGLYKKSGRNGKTIVAYGGDFGDKPNDGQFVMNGVVNSDRTPKPSWFEAKHVFQPVDFKFGGMKRNACGDLVPEVTIRNLNYFRDTSYCRFSFTLAADGKTVASGQLDPGAIPPRGEKTVLPDRYGRTGTIPEGAVLSLRVSAAAARNEGPLPAPSGTSYIFAEGDEIAYGQTDWTAEGAPEGRELPAAGGDVSFRESGGTMAFSTRAADGRTVEIRFDREGMLCGYSAGGFECVKEPMRIDALRGPSSNEVRPAQSWFAAGLGTLKHCDCTMSKPKKLADGSYAFTVSAVARPQYSEKLIDYGNGSTRIEKAGKPSAKAPRFEIAALWTVRPGGDVVFQSRIRPRGRTFELARIGYSIALDGSLARGEYFGDGPYDNYPDRRSGAKLGIHGFDTREPCPYARPEDYGTRGGMRAVRLTRGKSSAGIVVSTAGAPLWFSAIPYTVRELVENTHPAELPSSSKTVLTLSAAVRGLGGASCGPGPLARDIIRSDRAYELSFVLSARSDAPLVKAKVPPVKFAAAPVSSDPGDYPLVLECDSFEPGEDAEHLVDGNPGTIWHTQYGNAQSPYPHSFTLDLGRSAKWAGLRVLPRQDGCRNGRIRGYAVYGRNRADGGGWTLLAKGELPDTAKASDIRFPERPEIRYVRFDALSPQPGSGKDWASLAEVDALEN